MTNSDARLAAESLRGADICLDFANSFRGQAEAGMEGLENSAGKFYKTLAGWAGAQNLLASNEVLQLLAEGERRAAEAASVVRSAAALQGAIQRLFTAIAEKKAIEERDLALLNDAQARVSAYRLVTEQDGRFAWTCMEDAKALERVLWPVVWSALDLLTSPSLTRVRVCQADTCGWLFLDTSRNHSRRWCDMRQCGNVAKVRRYRRRHQESEQNASDV